MNFLFAINTEKNAVKISESPKGSNQISFVEEISKAENELLFQAVTTLTAITAARNFDSKIFKAMDKVCQMIYEKLKSNA